MEESFCHRTCVDVTTFHIESHEAIPSCVAAFGYTMRQLACDCDGEFSKTKAAIAPHGWNALSSTAVYQRGLLMTTMTALVSMRFYDRG